MPPSVIAEKRCVGARLRAPGFFLGLGAKLAGGGGSCASPVAVAGESAGGHLALVLALTGGDKRWQPGFERLDCTVCACVDVHGVHDFEDSSGYFHFTHRRHHAMAASGVYEDDAAAPERPAWFANLGDDAGAGDDDEADADDGEADGATRRPRRRKKSSFLMFLEQVVVQKDIRIKNKYFFHCTTIRFASFQV